VQHKTSSRSVGASSASFAPPFAGLAGIKSIRERAQAALPRPAGQSSFVSDLASLVDRLFAGRFWHYQPVDLRYHDYLHTLQASWVYLDLVASCRAHTGEAEAPTLRQAELGLAAILLHDTGYLKARGDDEGTGAKYTHCHVLRSCALAASVLPGLGCTSAEIEDILGAIRCTGLAGKPAATTFRTEAARLVACMVATADYLGQMSAPEYPAKLPFLFAEFSEADDYSGMPPERRPFKSSTQLLAATASFWTDFVRPRLDDDFAGVHRHLCVPFPDGPNPYLDAIERNLSTIARRAAALAAAPAGTAV
jgi:hypothetical protein